MYRKTIIIYCIFTKIKISGNIGIIVYRRFKRSYFRQVAWIDQPAARLALVPRSHILYYRPMYRPRGAACTYTRAIAPRSVRAPSLRFAFGSLASALRAHPNIHGTSLGQPTASSSRARAYRTLRRITVLGALYSRARMQRRMHGAPPGTAPRPRVVGPPASR